MDMHIFNIESNDTNPRKGKMLISSPFLMDYNFARSVILIVQHNSQGSMGIAVNKNFVYNISLNDVFPNIRSKVRIPLFRGGPIEKDSLFYIHRLNFVNDAISLGNGIYVNGDFNDIMDYLDKEEYNDNMIKFFCGYAGWQEGELEREINESSWILSPCKEDLIFDNHTEDIWNSSLDRLGGKYSVWSRYPKYPILN